MCEVLKVVLNFGRCIFAEHLRYGEKQFKFVPDEGKWAILRLATLVAFNVYLMFNNIYQISYVTWKDYDAQLACYILEFCFTFCALFVLTVDTYFVQKNRCDVLEELCRLDRLFRGFCLEVEARGVGKLVLNLQRWLNLLAAVLLVSFGIFYFTVGLRKGITVKLFLVAYTVYKGNFHWNVVLLTVDKIEVLVETIPGMTFTSPCHVCRRECSPSFASLCPLHCVTSTRELYNSVEGALKNTIRLAKHFQAIATLLSFLECGLTFYAFIEIVLLHRTYSWQNVLFSGSIVAIMIVGFLLYLHAYNQAYEQSIRLALALQRMCTRYSTSTEVRLEVQRFSFRVVKNTMKLDCVTFDLSYPAMVTIGHWAIFGSTYMVRTGISAL